MLHVNVHALNTHDTAAACCVFEEAPRKYLTLKSICADAGNRKTFEGFVQNILKKNVDTSEGIVSKVVKRAFA